MGSEANAFLLYRRVDHGYDDGGPDEFLGVFSSMEKAVDVIASMAVSGGEYLGAISMARRELARKRPSYPEMRRWAAEVVDLDHRAWVEHMLATNPDGWSFHIEAAQMDKPRATP